MTQTCTNPAALGGVGTVSWPNSISDMEWVVNRFCPALSLGPLGGDQSGIRVKISYFPDGGRQDSLADPGLLQADQIGKGVKAYTGTAQAAESRTH